ncbi:P-loop containing nucleoside triphosphate hydrolase protein [Laetiporus sulphureus 93-53]|uniref:p-loop containing nucleoside triphosphate hydrolase protein n=1 Tax=Laetiporus sulphureus 93-53 TaxID=1314785 RepID=A0A165BRA7_9APHY|nr:P-loop containing nucleoside triphosphate hydrolase protein [Laetiporus sulphureus 93-53]KZT01509.1 P-loop containing nucleoside triphosphate hydrolase protein [Laetiporus sulphureus 93-53]
MGASGTRVSFTFDHPRTKVPRPNAHIAPRDKMPNSTMKTKVGKRKSTVILVMGPTGAGKTTFINLASGSKLRVGKGLESTTTRMELSKPFKLDGHDIALVDTPGFDDTMRSDAEILTIIAAYLSYEFLKNTRLVGVIYLHRISDNRMGGIALRNFRMFVALCGRMALPNAAIVLNMWNEVDPEVALRREEELVSKDIFFKPAIDAGASVFHHDNGSSSAEEIIRHMSSRRPIALAIQIELVKQRKPLRDTAAGMALLGDLAEKQRKNEEQLRHMQEEINDALARQDEDDREELEQAHRRLDGIRRRIDEDSRHIQTFDNPTGGRPAVIRPVPFSTSPLSSQLALPSLSASESQSAPTGLFDTPSFPGAFHVGSTHRMMKRRAILCCCIQ